MALGRRSSLRTSLTLMPATFISSESEKKAMAKVPARRGCMRGVMIEAAPACRRCFDHYASHAASPGGHLRHGLLLALAADERSRHQGQRCPQARPSPQRHSKELLLGFFPRGEVLRKPAHRLRVAVEGARDAACYPGKRRRPQRQRRFQARAQAEPEAR